MIRFAVFALALTSCASHPSLVRDCVSIPWSGDSSSQVLALPHGGSDDASRYVLLGVPCLMDFAESFILRAQVAHRGYAIVFEGREPEDNSLESTFWLLESERVRVAAQLHNAADDAPHRS